eukprot:1314316-Rhodomonas_salina.1
MAANNTEMTFLSGADFSQNELSHQPDSEPEFAIHQFAQIPPSFSGLVHFLMNSWCDRCCESRLLACLSCDLSPLRLFSMIIDVLIRQSIRFALDFGWDRISQSSIPSTEETHRRLDSEGRLRRALGGSFCMSHAPNPELLRFWALNC